MLAALLSLAILVVLWVVGFAAVSLCNRNRSLLVNALIAPAVGAVVLLVPTMLLSQSGLAVHTFALPLVAISVILAVVTLVFVRPVFPLRVVWPVLLICGLAFFLMGRPFFDFGFNWVSFSNDDMLNYSLAADRFAQVPFYQAPPLLPDETFRGYESTYWFEYIVGGERSGVELLLALVISITHLRGFQAFMPFIIAGGVALVASSSAMLAARSSRPAATYVLAALMAASALATLGALYELLGQVFGLLTLTATTALLVRPETFARVSWRTLPRLILCGALVGGQLLIYPELLLFSIFAVAAYAVLLVSTRRRRVAAIALPGLIAFGTIAVLTGRNFVTMALLIWQRFGSSVIRAHGQGVDQRFPYYLIPSGFANLWGFFPVATLPADPWLSIAIALGALLTAVTLVLSVRYAFMRVGAAIVCAMMLLLALVLFHDRSEFALYKIAMYLQPFLLATFALLLVRMRMKAVAAAALLFMLVANVFTTNSYIEVSRNLPNSTGSGFIEVAHASATRLIDQLARMQLPERATAVFSDAPIVSLAKYESGYVTGVPLFFVTRDFRGLSNPEWHLPIFADEHRRLFAEASRFLTFTAVYKTEGQFDFGGNRLTKFQGLFEPRIVRGHPFLLATTSQISILNRTSETAAQRDFALQDLGGVRDHIGFVESSLGRGPGSKDPEHVSLYQLEPDYFLRGQTMSALNRYLLLNVLRPTRTLRVVLNISASLASDGKNALPPVTVVGDDRASFHAVGRGSAQLVSDPVRPKMIDGAAYIGLDMGRNGKRFPTIRSGLMRWFGTDLALDPRIAVVFGRNISAVSEDTYERWNAPESISDFPDCLKNAQLVYSGIYEDGWISERSYAILRSAQSDADLKIEGLVPLLEDPNFHTRLLVRLDGKLVDSEQLAVGTFTVDTHVRLKSGKHVVALAFDNIQSLPHRDRRPVAAKITFLGFAPPGG